MSPDRRPSDPPKSTPLTEPLGRRRFIAWGAALGAASVAGCTASTPDSGGNDGSTEEQAGHFRLLISDQPVAIDEFDSLVVHLDRARVFSADDEDEAEGEMEPTTTSEPSETPTPTETPESTDTPSPTETEEEAAEETDESDNQEGFYAIDLEGESVDLTTLLGEKALSVFEGSLPAGRYTKIELYAASVEGVVDGAKVDVKIPSEKLQIIKPFEVEAGKTVNFVFDITVVRKGPSGGYNLIPVIAKSGVAGKDVEMQEVDPDDTSEDADGSLTSGDDEETEVDGDDQEGPPNDAPVGGQTDTPEA